MTNLEHSYPCPVMYIGAVGKAEAILTTVMFQVVPSYTAMKHTQKPDIPCTAPKICYKNLNFW